MENRTKTLAMSVRNIIYQSNCNGLISVRQGQGPRNNINDQTRPTLEGMASKTFCRSNEPRRAEKKNRKNNRKIQHRES